MPRRIDGRTDADGVVWRWALHVQFEEGWALQLMLEAEQTYFGQSDFGQFFDRLWPIVGLTDFGQADFGQF